MISNPIMPTRIETRLLELIIKINFYKITAKKAFVAVDNLTSYKQKRHEIRTFLVN